MNQKKNRNFETCKPAIKNARHYSVSELIVKYQLNIFWILNGYPKAIKPETVNHVLTSIIVATPATQNAFI